MFQILNQLVKPFNLEVGKHRDIESQNYPIDTIMNKQNTFFFYFHLSNYLKYNYH